jgi:hypothetical protein
MAQLVELHPHRISSIVTSLRVQRDRLLGVTAILNEEFTKIAEKYNQSIDVVWSICYLARYDFDSLKYNDRASEIELIVGNEYDAIEDAVLFVLSNTHRCSSMVENSNSRVRPYLDERKFISQNKGDEGLYVEIQKTQKKVDGKVLFQWNDDLKEIIARAERQVSYRNESAILFCNKRGQQYTGDGFGKLWRNLMNEAMKKGVIKEHFVFRDLRRKAASDLEAMSGREAARKLLGHSSQTMTKKYISGAQKVEALSLQNLFNFKPEKKSS